MGEYFRDMHRYISEVPAPLLDPLHFIFLTLLCSVLGPSLNAPSLEDNPSPLNPIKFQFWPHFLRFDSNTERVRTPSDSLGLFVKDYIPLRQCIDLKVIQHINFEDKRAQTICKHEGYMLDWPTGKVA